MGKRTRAAEEKAEKPQHTPVAAALELSGGPAAVAREMNRMFREWGLRVTIEQQTLSKYASESARDPEWFAQRPYVYVLAFALATKQDPYTLTRVPTYIPAGLRRDFM